MSCQLTKQRLRAASSGPSIRVLGVGAALLFAMLGPAFAQEPSIPQPRGLVNDFAQVLDRGTVAYLNALIGDLRAKTGAEIAVVTVRSTKPLSAFDYAMRIAETWKPGAPGKDNGVVFLVATEDRELFIATGYGIEGALPDGRVGEIRDRIIVPSFRQGGYGAGIRAGTEAMAAVIAREYDVELSATSGRQRRQRRRPSGGVASIPFFILIMLFVLLGRAGLLPLLLFGSLGRRGMYGGSFGGGGFGGGFGGFGGGGFGGGGAGGGW